MNRRCDQCAGFLKHKIKTDENGTIVRNKDGTPMFEPFGNNTTKYGGLLCSRGAQSLSYRNTIKWTKIYTLHRGWIIDYIRY